MTKKNIYIAGEDDVTRAILERVIADYAPKLNVARHLPARGSELKNKIAQFNALSKSTPVVLLSDLDTDDCAPVAKAKLLGGLGQNGNFIINIAVDEAEAWLFADKEGFSEYLKIPIELMPEAKEMKFGGRNGTIEMDIPLKSSYYLTHSLISRSKNDTLRLQIEVPNGIYRSKGKEYNPAILPFINRLWNIENARKRSYSLEGMIRRIQLLNDKI